METAEQGSQIPSTEVTLQALAKVPIPQSSVEDENKVVEVKMPIYDEKVDFSSKFVSHLRLFGMSPLQNNPLFDFDMKFTFESSQREDFYLKMLDYRFKILHEYDKVYVDMPKELEPQYKEDRILTPNAMGLNLYSLIDTFKMKHSTYHSLLQNFKKLRVQDVNDANDPLAINKETVIFCGLRQEKDLTTGLRDINVTRYGLEPGNPLRLKFDELHDWYSAYFNNSLQYIAPLPIRDDRFEFFPAPGPFQSWPKIIEANPLLINAYDDICRNYAQNSIILPTTTLAESFTQMLREIRVRTQSIDKVADFPGRIDTNKARQFPKDLMITLLSKYAKLYNRVNLESLEMSTVIGIISGKLLIPKTCMHPDTLIDWDNYLAHMLVPLLPGYTPGNIPKGFEWNSTNALLRKVNYLTVYRKSNVLRGTGATEFWEFVEGYGTNEGYADAGTTVADAPSLPPNSGKLIGRTGQWFMPITGSYSQEEFDLYTQFERFSSWYHKVSNLVDGRGKDGYIAVAIMKILSFIVRRKVEIRNMINRLDKITRRLTLSSIFLPNLRDTPDYKSIEAINFDIDGPFSTLILVLPEAITMEEITYDMIKAGWSLHDWANELVETHHLVEQWYKIPILKPRYTRADRWKKTFELMSLKHPFGAAMEQVILGTELYLTISIPDSTITQNWLEKKLVLVDKFIADTQGIAGWSDHFFHLFGVLAASTSDSTFRRLWFANSDSNVGYTIEQLQDILSKGKLPDLEERRIRGDVIRINVPVTIESVEVKEFAPTHSCLSFPDNNKVKVDHMKFFFQFNDVVPEHDRNQLATNHVDDRIEFKPFIDQGFAVINTFMHPVTVYRKPFRKFEEFKVITRS